MLKRDFPSCVAHGHAQVVTMDSKQPLTHDKPEPQEKRQLRPEPRFSDLPRQIEISVLNHIRRVDPALQPGIQAESNHLAETRPMALEQLRKRTFLPGGRSLDEIMHEPLILDHDVSPKGNLRAEAGKRQKNNVLPILL
jgi:hypothetical protein